MRRRLPSIVAGGLVVAGLVACGQADETSQSTSGTVAHVGELPDLQTGRGPDGRPAPVAPVTATGAAPDETVEDTEPDDTVDSTEPERTVEGTDPNDTDPDDTDPDVSDPDGTDPDGTDPADTVDSTDPDGTDPDGTDPDGTDPDGALPAIDDVIGAAADGNRILAVGDSIIAAIGPQYGGQLCDRLEDQGWFLGVDAFQGRAIDAGLTVLREEIDLDEWDAAIVNLGSNYRGDAADYARDLRQILTLLRSMPVVVVTVTEFQDDIAEVNYVIRDVAAEGEQVGVLEWSEITRDDGSLTGGDGLHLSEDGRVALAGALAEAVGDAPIAAGTGTEPGCELLRDAEADEAASAADGGSGTDATADGDTGDGGADAGGG